MTQFETSRHFSEREKVALRLALAMARTPAQISDELYAALRDQFSERELVELSGVIAWEDGRARFNRVFSVQSEGYSHGQFCPMPER